MDLLSTVVGAAIGAVLVVGALLAVAVRRAMRGERSSVRTIHPDGSETVERETRTRRPSELKDVEGNVGGENSRVATGENVHAVLRQGQG